jgi:hypothetical protein
VPPKLMLYSVAAAIVIILAVLAGMAYYIHSQNADDGSAPQATAEATQTYTAQQQPAPAPQPTEQTAAPEPAPAESEPEVTVTPRYAPKPRRPSAQPVKRTVVPGELAITSTPQGAQVQVDGRSDPGWITPFNIPGLAPGQHVVTVTRAGFATETKVIDVSSGSKSFVAIHLAAVGATLSIASEPSGANIYIDGKDTGHLTPAQIVAGQGRHTILVRKPGYLDEISTNDFLPGQSFHFSPTLKALGVTDDIKTGGKFKRLFGGDSTAGMGKVTIKTQPKGAQITVNRRMVDKPTPVDFMLNPGNYIIDITASGYKPIQRVVTVEKGSKIELNESLDPQ